MRESPRGEVGGCGEIADGYGSVNGCIGVDRGERESESESERERKLSYENENPGRRDRDRGESVGCHVAAKERERI